LPPRGALRSQRAIDADRDERADGEGHRIEIGHLPARIEEREKEDSGDPAGDTTGDDLEDDETGAARTAVPVCKVPLAAGTGGHELGNEAPEKIARRDV
jgi:hypothetical protein